MFAAGEAAAQAARPKPADRAAGITIAAEHEAPQSLYVVPWIESFAAPPPALLQSGLPAVFEHDRSLAADPLNRSLALLQAVKQEARQEAERLDAEKAAAQKRKRRRNRDDDER
jgi:hypothetical protein